MVSKQWKAMVLVIVGVWGCASPRIVSIREWENMQPVSFNRILVATITGENNDSIRTALESEAARQLSEFGINAISSNKEFGPHGFRFTVEESAYIALCEKGIDAVLTFAEVEQSEGSELAKGFSKKYSSVYYYNHIWNYRNRRNDTTILVNPSPSRFVWECILFDLNSLEPRVVLLSRSFASDISQENKVKLLKEIISKLIKLKIIKPKESQQQSLKAF